MDIEERYALIMRNVEELITESELRNLLATKEQPIAYIGFEPSGLVHMGWALVAGKIRDLANAGFKVIIFWADWHAYINDKLGGDLDNIRTCARYMEDCFIALGVPRESVEFRYASDVLSEIEYWEKVIKVAKVTSLSRVKRAMTIMGRSEDEADVDSSKLFYPILQATDIFSIDVDLAYAGIDQRRAHMLARDAAEKLHWRKPIAIHTPLLPGLAGGNRMDPTASKMSKSDPNKNINIHDTPDEIKRKMKKAFCPPNKEEEDTNPILMIAKYIIFPTIGCLHINRPDKYGGPVSYDSYEALTNDYYTLVDGKALLSPMDLKDGVADGMNKCLAPVAEYFEMHPENYNAMIEVLKKLGKF